MNDETLFQVMMVAFVATLVNLYAQECIVVQDGNEMTVYYTSCLDEAFNDAPTGAVIYLAGGNYSFCQSATVIDKKLTIIGAGGFVKGTPITN